MNVTKTTSTVYTTFLFLDVHKDPLVTFKMPTVDADMDIMFKNPPPSAKKPTQSFAPTASYPNRQTDVKVMDDFFAQEIESMRKWSLKFDSVFNSNPFHKVVYII